MGLFNKTTEATSLNIVARAPFRVYYEGTAQSITAKNKVGEFDILPGHADLFSILEPGDIIIETTGQPVTFHANNGIMSVRHNEVMLFVNI